MPTLTCNDPINGDELKTILIKHINAALDRDSTLGNDVEYPGWEFSYSIQLKYSRAGNKDSLVWGGDKGGEPIVPVEGMVLNGAEVMGTYTSTSPNETREEFDLPIPISVPLPNGGTEKQRRHLPKGGR